MPLPSGFREVVIALITAPMTVQAARTIAATVNPYFLKISFDFFRKAACLFPLLNLCSEL